MNKRHYLWSYCQWCIDVAREVGKEMVLTLGAGLCLTTRQYLVSLPAKGLTKGLINAVPFWLIYTKEDLTIYFPIKDTHALLKVLYNTPKFIKLIAEYALEYANAKPGGGFLTDWITLLNSGDASKVLHMVIKDLALKNPLSSAPYWLIIQEEYPYKLVPIQSSKDLINFLTPKE